MWKLIIIALIAFAIWKFYPQLSTFNFDTMKQNAINSAKNEKIIHTVNETRQKTNQEAQDAINN